MKKNTIIFIIMILLAALAGCKSAPEQKPVEEPPRPVVETPPEKPAPKEEPAPEPVVTQPRADNKHLLYFAPMSYTIGSTTKAKLDRLIRDMKENNIRDVTIKGHTALLDSPEEEQRLALKRVIAVADYITKSGIVHTAHIEVVGVGADEPAAPHADITGRRLNRRVEIIY